MGMFDYVQCDYPLPDGQIAEGPVFQTKDFNCFMDIVRITREGRVILQATHYEDVPKAERPEPDAPDSSLMAMRGCIRRVVDSEYDAEFHGDMHFYDLEREFIARFTEGQLKWIKPLTLFEPPPAQEPRHE